MKTCPVCQARCFDDMEVCFGCMHRFSADAPAQADQGSADAPVIVRSSGALGNDNPTGEYEPVEPVMVPAAPPRPDQRANVPSMACVGRTKETPAVTGSGQSPALQEVLVPGYGLVIKIVPMEHAALQQQADMHSSNPRTGAFSSTW